MTEFNPLTVAVQMDPMEGINIAGDSTFHIMLAGQARGHKLYHYLAPDLSYRDGRVLAQARPVKVQKGCFSSLTRYVHYFFVHEMYVGLLSAPWLNLSNRRFTLCTWVVCF